MLSHDHLARLSERRTQTIIADKAFIGIYIPTELEWVGGLKNKPWQTERDKHGRRWHSHRGRAVGGEAALWIWPEGQLVVGLVANASDEGREHGDTYREAKRLADEFADAVGP